MRVSSYLIAAPIPNQDKVLLLHGYTGALDKVPSWLGEELLKNRGGDIANLKCADSLTDTIINTLVSRGYITALTHDEERNTILTVVTSLHERDLRNNPTGFMLIPSYKCNLRCSYCFQGHDMHGGKGKFAALMTRSQVDQIFCVIDSFDAPGAVARKLGLIPGTIEQQQTRDAERTGSIALFGGEPLQSETRAIVEYILNQANRRNKTLNAITNGVELHLFTDLLGPGKIEQLQITLDGGKGHHDKRRIGPANKATFDTIIRNIDLALSRGVKVSTRLNIDSQNSADLEELAHEFQQRGWDRRNGFSAYAAAVHQERQAQAVVTRTQLVQLTLRSADNSNDDYQIRSYEKTADELLSACIDGRGYPFRRSVFW